MSFVDSHCHIDGRKFGADRDEVIQLSGCGCDGDAQCLSRPVLRLPTEQADEPRN